jgi:hypothetical protein
MAGVLTGKMPVLRETAFFNGLLSPDCPSRQRWQANFVNAAVQQQRGKSFTEILQLVDFADTSAYSNIAYQPHQVVLSRRVRVQSGEKQKG